MKKLLILSILSLCVVAPAFAAGQTVGDVANKVMDTTSLFPDFIGALSYICGIALGIKGILKLKEHNESKGQVKLVIPIVLVISSAMLLALPSVVSIGTQTLGFKPGDGKTSTGQTKSKYDSNY